MLTIAPRNDAMNRLGRAMADPSRSRILLSLLQAPGYPAELASSLNLTRSNASNHLTPFGQLERSPMKQQNGV